MKHIICWFVLFIALKLTAQPDVFTDYQKALQQADKVKKLDLSGQKINYIGNEIAKFTELESLDLSANQLHYLPDEMGSLSKLKLLNISNNPIDSFPTSLANLCSLEELYFNQTLSPNWYENIAYNSNYVSVIAQLSYLKYLSLNNLLIDRLSADFCELNQLEYLSLANNLLVSLPDSIGNLAHLHTLTLTNSRITELPASFEKLQCLSRLSLKSNKITHFPAINQLKKLEMLDISTNPLRKADDEVQKICELTRLQQLNISNLGLNVLPENIGQLKGLTSLDMSFNNIQHFPASFAQVENIVTLNISRNNLLEFCFTQNKMTNLDLSYNHLTEICDNIGGCSALKSIDLTGNKSLFKISNEIVHCENLKILNLKNTQIIGKNLNDLQWLLTNVQIFL